MSSDRQSFPFLTGIPAGPIRNALITVWKRFNGNTPVTQITGLVTRETLVGQQDSANTRFFTRVKPVAGSESLFVNGLLQTDGGVNYQIQDTAIVFTTPPAPGDVIRISYRVA